MKSLCVALLLSICINARAADTALWRIGSEDNKSDEFTGKAYPATFDIPQDWSTRTDWPEIPAHVGSGAITTKPTDHLDTTIRYQLKTVPQYGARFHLKTVNASDYVTELAIFANDMPCGIMQLVGTENGLPKFVFGQSFDIYVPAEFLHAGDNTLRIWKLGHTYNRSVEQYLSLTLDDMALFAYDAPPDEPIHSRNVHYGFVWGEFGATPAQDAGEAAACEWTGSAYSGNPVRVSFWNDTWGDITKPPEKWGVVKDPMAHLKTMRQYHMRTIANFLNCASKKKGGPDWLNGDELTDHWKQQLDVFFSRYGNYLDYYEICNEPCMRISDDPLDVVYAVTKYIKQIKPATMRLSPPGWTYGGGYGEPVNWDVDVANRQKIEALCDTTNGHSYGQSYRAAVGGSFANTIQSFSENGVITNGFPREMINTETGTAPAFHVDPAPIAGTELHAAVLDRIHRAHLGFCDTTMHYSAFGEGPYRLMQGDSLHPETWYASLEGTRTDEAAHKEQSMLQVLRRIILAYSTHGKPLAYSYAKPEDVANQLVYFRAVDTSSLALLPGEEAVPKKILLSFVNFSDQPKTMTVKVTFPETGAYRGTRFGADDDFMAAKSSVLIGAQPQATITETVGPMEAIGYCLEHDTVTKDVPALPAVAPKMTAEGHIIGKLAYVKLNWPACGGATQLKIERSEDGGNRFRWVDNIDAKLTTYDDASLTGPQQGKHYVYRLITATAAGEATPGPVCEVDTPTKTPS